MQIILNAAFLRPLHGSKILPDSILTVHYIVSRLQFQDIGEHLSFLERLLIPMVTDRLGKQFPGRIHIEVFRSESFVIPALDPADFPAFGAVFQLLCLCVTDGKPSLFPHVLQKNIQWLPDFIHRPDSGHNGILQVFKLMNDLERPLFFKSHQIMKQCIDRKTPVFCHQFLYKGSIFGANLFLRQEHFFFAGENDSSRDVIQQTCCGCQGKHPVQTGRSVICPQPPEVFLHLFRETPGRFLIQTGHCSFQKVPGFCFYFSHLILCEQQIGGRNDPYAVRGLDGTL